MHSKFYERNPSEDICQVEMKAYNRLSSFNEDCAESIQLNKSRACLIAQDKRELWTQSLGTENHFIGWKEFLEDEVKAQQVLNRKTNSVAK